MALGEWLQIDGHSSAVGGHVSSVRTDKRGEAFNGRVRENSLGKLLLFVGHGFRANRGSRLRNALNDAGILNREEAFGDNDVKKNREQERTQGDEKSNCLIFEYDF